MNALTLFAAGDTERGERANRIRGIRTDGIAVQKLCSDGNERGRGCLLYIRDCFFSGKTIFFGKIYFSMV